MSTLHIDAARLMSRIDALGKIGATPQGGVRRLALSEEDRLARDQVVDWMRAAGLEVDIDCILNYAPAPTCFCIPCWNSRTRERCAGSVDPSESLVQDG